jgi:methylated-DNA-protein-cysteine methyltransferase-like protein
MYAEFTRLAIAIIKTIPPGKVLTYGAVARLAGSPGGARQVTRILHSLSAKEQLPWHRVISASGKLSLPTEEGKEEQAMMLRAEGVVIERGFRVDLRKYHLDRVRFGE